MAIDLKKIEDQTSRNHGHTYILKEMKRTHKLFPGIKSSRTRKNATQRSIRMTISPYRLAVSPRKGIRDIPGKPCEWELKAQEGYSVAAMSHRWLIGH